MSAVAAMTPVVIGSGVAVAANGLVRPLFGLAVGMGDSAAIGVVLTGIAMVRSSVLRRMFEAIRMRRSKTTTAGPEGPAARGIGSADQAASMIR